MIVVSWKIVCQAVGTSLYRYIVWWNATILQYIAYPIGVLRIVYLLRGIGIIVAPIIGVRTVWYHLVVIEVLLFLEHIDIVHEISGIKRLNIFIVSHHWEWSFVRNFHFPLFAAFCGDEDNSVGGIDTIDSCWGILKHLNAFYILRV